MRAVSLVVALVIGVPLRLLAPRRAGLARGAETATMSGVLGFVGSWRVTVFEADGPPTLALATFGADGTVVAAEHPVVTPPIAPGAVFTSSGHGAWVATGPNAATMTFVGLGSYGHGVLFGTATARSTVTLDADGQTFNGPVVWTVADPSGTPMATYGGTFQAARIVAEAPELLSTAMPPGSTPHQPES